ncbi:hypothetical protein ACWC9T_27515 [Kitasatospora sp. NPDC001159]
MRRTAWNVARRPGRAPAPGAVGMFSHSTGGATTVQAHCACLAAHFDPHLRGRATPPFDAPSPLRPEATLDAPPRPRA